MKGELTSNVCSYVNNSNFAKKRWEMPSCRCTVGWFEGLFRFTKNLVTFCLTSWILGPIWSPLSSFWSRFFGQIIVLCWHFLPASRWMARAIFIWIIFHTSRDMGQLLHFSANMAFCAVTARKTRVSGIAGECYIVGQKPAIFLEFLWGYLTH